MAMTMRKFIAFSVFGKSMSNFNHKEGDRINVYFDIESREYNGRYYTEAKAYQFRRTSESSPALNGDMANQFNEDQNLF
jgi:hypothetical protein